jgi:hypothetical protein
MIRYLMGSWRHSGLGHGNGMGMELDTRKYSRRNMVEWKSFIWRDASDAKWYLKSRSETT